MDDEKQRFIELTEDLKSSLINDYIQLLINKNQRRKAALQRRLRKVGLHFYAKKLEQFVEVIYSY